MSRSRWVALTPSIRSKAAPKPRHRCERDAKPIPSSPDVFPWRANELVRGVPRADRRSGATNVADMTVGRDGKPRQ